MFVEDPLAGFKLSVPPRLENLFLYFGFTRLSDHLHEIILAALIYTAIYLGSSFIAPYLIPQYKKLSTRNRVNFDMHVVSQIQSVWLCTAAISLMFSPHLTTLTSYTPYAGMVTATATGYFIWDLFVSLKYVKEFGVGFMVHALAALVTFWQTSRPFLLNFAAPFIWFEASTPFVNNHWFATHVPGLFSENFKTKNGLCLLTVFFLCRIVSGPYNGYKLFTEAFEHPPTTVPYWALVMVLTSYASLMSLNFLWFSKMVKMALRTLNKTKATKAD